MDIFFQDLRYALRTLLKRRGFTLVAISIIALGIGLNTALLSVVEATLVQTLPFEDPERVAVIGGTFDDKPLWLLSILELRDVIERSTSFETIGFFNFGVDVTLTGQGMAESLTAAYASAGFFEALGAPPAYGRTFLPEEDDGLGAHPVVLLSHEFWRQRYDGDPGVLDSRLQIGGIGHTIVGILPQKFEFIDVDVWLPLSASGPTLDRDVYTSRWNRRFFGVARFAEGRGLEGASQELGGIAAQLEAENPESHRGRGFLLIPLRDFFLGNLEQPVRLLWAGAGLVLLICCVNVAALLLVRSISKRREIALRSALGAPRRRLVSQFLLESLLLTAVGGALGIALAAWATRLFVAGFDLRLPAFTHITVDRGVLGFSVVLIVVLGLALGLFPGLRYSRVQPREALQEGSRQMGGSRRAILQRGGMVALEIAVAVVLLVGAGLTLKSLYNIASTDLGYDPGGLVTMRLDLRGPRYAVPDKATADGARVIFSEQLLERLEAMPEVEGAVLWGPSMLGAADRFMLLTPEGLDSNVPENRFFARWMALSPGGLQTLDVPLRVGDEFTGMQRLGGQRVVMISQSLAERFWPDGDAVGKYLKAFRSTLEPPGDPWRVVAVVPELKHTGRLVGETARSVVGDVYFPFLISPTESASLMIKTRRGTDREAVSRLVTRVRQTVAEIDPDVPVADVATMSSRLARQEWVPRFLASMMSLYAGITGLLAFVGTYGLLAYSVRDRTSEIAMRSALGAPRRGLLAMVFRQGMTPVAVGVVIGLGVALALSKVLASLLFDVVATDPLVYLAVAVGVLLAAALACLLPARHAAGIDPALVLRYE